MATADLAFGPTRVRVVADDAALAWLDYFLRPWFAAVGSDSTHGAPREVELALDPVSLHSLATRADQASETVDCFLLDSRVVRLPVLERSDGWTWALDMAEQVAFGFRADGSVRIVAGWDSPSSRVALMRVVREIAVVDALADGRPLLHASVSEGSSGAVVICGRKRSGKTTLLLHRLTNGSERYIANDRGVAFDAGDDWRIRGMPTIVALRADSIARFPKVAGRLREAPDRHWQSPHEVAPEQRPWAGEDRPIDLAPAQLCTLLGVEATAEAPVRALLFPMLDATADRIQERSLSVDEACARLESAQVGADFRAEYRPVLATDATPSSRAGGDSAHAAAVAGLGEVPAFEVRLGRRAYEPADGGRSA